ncbi:MAG: phage tail tape measure protein, partial [Bacteroidales bacterium]|nr:phage tail tape measure protein [Bacteroidales bacterium]
MEVTARSKVIIDAQQAEAEIRDLTSEVKKYREAMTAATKANDKAAFDKAQQGWKRTSSALKETKKELFSVDAVMKNLSGSSMNQLRGAQRSLTAELKKMTRGTAEYVAKSKELHRVTAELRKVRTEMTGISGAQSSFFGKMANGFNKFGGMALGAIASLTGLGLTFRKLSLEADEYNSKVAELSALTGLAGEELEWLSKTAKELSTSTTESGVKITSSANDILDAYKIMGSARPDLLANKEALAEVTEKALILAEAAKMETAPAIDAVAAAMNQFDLGAEHSLRIINAFAAGSLAGSAEVDHLTQSFANVGTVADDSNLSLEQTVAVLEVLGEKQLKGAEAGTMLRSALLKMKAAGLGYESGMFNLRDALVEANAKLETFSTNLEKDAYKQETFGQRSIVVGTILLDNIEKYDSLTEAVTGTNTAIEQATINTDTNKASLKQAQNRFKLVAMELGQRLSPAFRSVMVTSGTLVRGIVELVKWFDKYGKYILIATAGIVGYTIALKAQVIWTNIVTTATKLAEFATRAFNAAMKSSPIGLLVGLLAAAATAFAIFRKKAGSAAEGQKEVNEAIKEFDELMGNTKSLEERMTTIDKLNKRQLDNLKQDVQSQLASHEDYASKLELQRAQKIKQLNSELETQLSDPRIPAAAKKTIQEIHDYQVARLNERYNNEVEFQQKTIASLNAHAADIEAAYKNIKDNIIEKSYDDLLAALNEHNKQQRLATQRSYLQGITNKEERDAAMQVQEIAHLTALLALQKNYGEEYYDTEYKLTQELIKLKESVAEAHQRVLDQAIKDNEINSEKLIEQNIKDTDAALQAEFEAYDAEVEAKRKANEEKAQLDQQAFDAYAKKMEQYKAVAGNMASALGDLLGRASTDAEMTAQEVAREMLLIALDSLHGIVLIAMA